MIPLPRTLALLHSPALLATIREELTPSHLPLELYLTRGGWPESPRIEVRGVRENNIHAEVLLTVEFIEQCPAACPSSARPETRIAYMLARIRKQDALTEILPDE